MWLRLPSPGYARSLPKPFATCRSQSSLPLCQQPCFEVRRGSRRALLLVSRALGLGPAPAALSGAAARNQAAAAARRLPARFKDNAGEGKGLIQPECSVGTPCTRAWFGRGQWGSLRGRAVCTARQDPTGGSVENECVAPVQ